ncbi:MAG: hypothetical protein AAGH99_03580 [Planctomycetota bacterium]
MNETTADPEKPAAQDAPKQAGRQLPPFSPGRFQHELAFDGLLRTGAGVSLFAAFFTLLSFGGGSSVVAAALAIAIVVGWIVLSALGAKVAQALPGVTALLENNAAVGESTLAELLSKRALPRGLRLMLFHRLAMLRHRQQNFVESSAIAQTLLTTPRPGPAAANRAHLLLMLAEARLELRDAAGAWLALVELARTPLGLTEALQRMALNTRYALLVNQPAYALAGFEQKMSLSELMPAPQCGAFHAMLAAAAKRVDRDDWFEQIWPRVELLCSEEEIAHMHESRLISG